MGGDVVAGYSWLGLVTLLGSEDGGLAELWYSTAIAALPLGGASIWTSIASLWCIFERHNLM
jgi:hypothetical protein